MTTHAFGHPYFTPSAPSAASIVSGAGAAKTGRGFTAATLFVGTFRLRRDASSHSGSSQRTSGDQREFLAQLRRLLDRQADGGHQRGFALYGGALFRQRRQQPSIHVETSVRRELLTARGAKHLTRLVVAKHVNTDTTKLMCAAARYDVWLLLVLINCQAAKG